MIKQILLAVVAVALLVGTSVAQLRQSSPRINPSSYIPAKKVSQTITVSLKNVSLAGATSATATRALMAARDTASQKNDLGLLINEANKQLTAIGGGTVSIEGGGSIRTQVQLDHHTRFDSSTYSCDIVGITDAGCFLVNDNVLVEGTYRPPTALLE